MFVPSHKLSTLIDSLMGIIIQMSAVTKTPTVSAAMCDLSDAPRTHHERTTSQVKVILAEFTCQSFILWCHFAQVIKHWKHNEGRWCQMWPRKRSRKMSEFQGCNWLESFRNMGYCRFSVLFLCWGKVLEPLRLTVVFKCPA